MAKKKRYKDIHGTTKVGDFLRAIGKSGLVEKALGVAGNVVTGNYLEALKTLVSDPSEDMTDAEREFALKLLDQDRAEMQEVTKRWASDMVSDSWLSKNIRPLVLAYLVFIVTIIAICDSSLENFEVAEHWILLFKSILSIVVVAYFGSRGSEKVMKIFKKN